MRRRVNVTTVVGKDVLDAWVRNGPLAAAKVASGPPTECGWRVGPVPKLDDEMYVCVQLPGHAMPHRSSCGAWFEGCGYPPTVSAL